ncbi:NTP transferase domain-containing protein [Xanthomonas axonopodis pv. vasculorum]|uniref:Nucleotidyl transferase n=1 Tax=Xanthomonas axonopodis pv. vasculorum TaxID=325777 RepID=A0A098Q2Y6_9XANT|nr:NTP transferase domain-containing protein [Xanthomonas axonopodis]KGE53331.1 nucleotidyl transferase [Xanthomonas axonopodis pv. vasculorum]PPV10367.1 nucleotidyl transferase [Xanthomonas axonopodis pv. vasculorum]QKD87892.1 NTP transferase domain-containing protein [Xanthomonas axonopodis pv. vasculorum]
MRAIILAAGTGSRLRAHTELPKCLLKLGDRHLIQHQIDALSTLGIDDIHVILGYRSDDVAMVLPPHVQHHLYSGFADTNNLWTLAAFATLLSDTCVILFADVWVDSDALRDLVRTEAEIAVLADGRACLGGTMRMLAQGERLVDLGSHITVAQGDGNFIGIARFSARAASALGERIVDRVRRGELKQAYYTSVIPELSVEFPALVFWMGGRPWIEIDCEEDLRKANRLPIASSTSAPAVLAERNVQCADS